MSPRDADEATVAPQARPTTMNLGPPLLKPSADSLRAAEELASTSGRRVDIPVRKGFVRSLDDGKTPPPLSQIYAGGRSGLVAIKLYIALIWRCSALPFSTDKPARAWATLLDLPDPAGRGARRISHALQTLNNSKLITLTEQQGHPNLVSLSSETGSGASYSIPSTAYQFAKTPEQKDQHRYFKIAPRFWTTGEFQALSGPATVMLLILLAEQADTRDVWWSTEQFPLRYHISHKTRADGTHQLQERRILATRRQSLSSRAKESIFDDRRRRTVYRLFDPAHPADAFFWSVQ